MNTKISYLYRDASNYKVYNECVVKGVITPEQIQTILDCCIDEYFIPSKVGLPEKRFESWTDDDHIWFELNDFEDCFEETSKPANVAITCEELVEAFLRCKGNWEGQKDAMKEHKEQSSPVRMNTVLYNAISLLIDETFEQYDDTQEWFDMLQNELGVTADELEEMGIKITADGGLETVKEFNEDGYPREFVDKTIGQVLEQEAVSCLGCGLKFSGFNVTDAEVADVVEKMKETPQAFLDRDFIEAFCADALYSLRGLDPDKVRNMQINIGQLYRELEGAEVYDPGAADNIARVLNTKIDEFEEYVAGKSVEELVADAANRSKDAVGGSKVEVEREI